MHTFRTAFVLDFDGTVVRTFEPSPQGIGVHQAYQHAVTNLLGRDACAHYLAEGGLRNRAPREVVQRLLEVGYGNGCDLGEATEHLVEHKVTCLLTKAFGQPLEDGTPWPRLTQGFAVFWQKIKPHSDVFTAILSSGHEECIVKTFCMHNLMPPDLIVTDDEFRRLEKPICKPDPELWQYMLRKADVAFQSATYFGDDPIKDGGLARNVGVPFLHLAEKGTVHHGQEGTFDDWREIIPRFVEV